MAKFDEALSRLGLVTPEDDVAAGLV